MTKKTTLESFAQNPDPAADYKSTNRATLVLSAMKFERRLERGEDFG